MCDVICDWSTSVCKTWLDQVERFSAVCSNTALACCMCHRHWMTMFRNTRHKWYRSCPRLCSSTNSLGSITECRLDAFRCRHFTLMRLRPPCSTSLTVKEPPDDITVLDGEDKRKSRNHCSRASSHNLSTVRRCAFIYSCFSAKSPRPSITVSASAYWHRHYSWRTLPISSGIFWGRQYEPLNSDVCSWCIQCKRCCRCGVSTDPLYGQHFWALSHSLRDRRKQFSLISDSTAFQMPRCHGPLITLCSKKVDMVWPYQRLHKSVLQRVNDCLTSPQRIKLTIRFLTIAIQISPLVLKLSKNQTTHLWNDVIASSQSLGHSLKITTQRQNHAK